jgi:predicted nucleic acid-binding Zn finger protein
MLKHKLLFLTAIHNITPTTFLQLTNMCQHVIWATLALTKFKHPQITAHDDTYQQIVKKKKKS